MELGMTLLGQGLAFIELLSDVANGANKNKNFGKLHRIIDIKMILIQEFVLKQPASNALRDPVTT